MRFDNKNVIVTGGAMGIGKAVVQGIVAGGGTAIIVDLNLEAANKTKQELAQYPVHVYQADFGKSDEIRKVFAQIIADLGRVHVLVNNAGTISTKLFDEIDQNEWERVIRINLNGVYTAISSVYPHMKEHGAGRIVNVSSVAGKVGGGLLGTAAYATSKAGVNGLTKAVAKEGAKFGIYCNAVCPSATETAMTKALMEDPAKQNRVVGMLPLGRFAQPQEIANLILFFASDLASFITGEIGDCDGGLTMDG